MSKAREKILDLIGEGVTSPSVLAEKLGISRQALHRHLNVLLKDNEIEKEGSVPHVKYVLVNSEKESRVLESIVFFEGVLLPKYLKRFARIFEDKLQLGGKHPDFQFMLEASAVYSSNIEGNSLNLNSFLNSRMSVKKHRPKEAQEIEDLVAAYEFTKNHVLSEKNVLKVHAMLSREFVNKGRRGTYRKESVGVFSSRGMEYLAVEWSLVEQEMKQLFKHIRFLAKENLSVPHVFFWASWIHLSLALIHPFSDGNGRIARLCEKWFLAGQLGPEMYLLATEEHYFVEREAYYAALRLGVNYWGVDFKKADKFLGFLPDAIFN